MFHLKLHQSIISYVCSFVFQSLDVRASENISKGLRPKFYVFSCFLSLKPIPHCHRGWNDVLESERLLQLWVIISYLGSKTSKQNTVSMMQCSIILLYSSSCFLQLVSIIFCSGDIFKFNQVQQVQVFRQTFCFHFQIWNDHGMVFLLWCCLELFHFNFLGGFLVYIT